MKPAEFTCCVLLASVSGLVVLIGLTSIGAEPGAPGPDKIAIGSGVLDRNVLKRAKESTVFVQVRQASYLDDKIRGEGSGSAFVISPNGHVVTNWHVIAPLREIGRFAVPMRRDEVQVIFRSGKRGQELLPAKVLAADVESDLALLKVERKDCPHLTLAAKENIVETMPVVSLGFPFGSLFSVLQRGPEISVNRGYVTSLRHDDLGNLERIQFDAVVNKGNSGGPLILDNGQVLGVTNIALGTSRVNFAVPVTRLREFLKGCPIDCEVGKESRVTITSEPKGAKVYLDSKLLGQTPLQTKVEGGYRPLAIVAHDHRLWAKHLSLHEGKKIHVKLKPSKTIVLKVVPSASRPAARGLGGLLGRLKVAAPDAKKAVAVEESPKTKPFKRGKEIFAEKFDKPEAAEAWRQDTGGHNQRTWYVQDGAFHQFEADELLHAVYAGDPKWTDYTFSSRVRIATNEADGRAGLILRATDEGFALFRLHRQTSKVQLAYHSNNLFGWQILAERSLPFRVEDDRWYQMEVQALGSQIICLLDGKVVLEATTDQILSGGIGFYSVDSRASFDDVRVTAVSGGDGRKPAKQVSLRSFWITDPFAKDSGLWQSRDDATPGVPWPVVPGGCIQISDTPSVRMNILQQYDIYDSEIRCLVSAKSGTVGLVFRHDGDRRYLLAVDFPNKKARLVLQDKDQQTVLGTAGIARAIGAVRAELMPGMRVIPFWLYVRAKGDKIEAGVNDTLITKTDDTLRHGRVGFYTKDAKAVFHNITIASPDEGP